MERTDCEKAPLLFSPEQIQTNRINSKSTIVVQEVSTRKQFNQFIYLPANIHKNHSNWVPPIYIDEKEFFNPKKNKSFQMCDTILLLAYRGTEVVGRIMGIIHKQYNADRRENHARFAFFETWNDPEVAFALISFVENWAKGKGMVKLIGPLAFSDKDPQGFLIEGFDEPAVIASNCNFPYQVELLQVNNFSKEIDLVVYQIKVPNPIPEFYLKIQERAIRMNKTIRIMEFTSRRKVKPYIHPVLRLLNNTFTEIFGFVPFTEAEMDDFANRYLFLINPRFIKIAVDEHNQVIGFIIGMAHIAEGIRNAKGRLIPFGIFQILHSAKKSKQLNLLLGGIHPNFRGKGIDAMMGVKMLESAVAEGKTHIDSHLELETNLKVRAEMERMEGRVYKRFRIFGKNLQ